MSFDVYLVTRKARMESMPDHIRALYPKRMVPIQCFNCGTECMKNPDLDRYIKPGWKPVCIDCWNTCDSAVVASPVPQGNVDAANRLCEAVEEHERRN